VFYYYYSDIGHPIWTGNVHYLIWETGFESSSFVISSLVVGDKIGSVDPTAYTSKCVDAPR